jgi:hypothetical protein
LAARVAAIVLGPALLALAGCETGHVIADPSNATFSISPAAAYVDTNCTGCNAANLHGGTVQRFTATLAGGGDAPVVWSVSGGDATSGPGSITPSGQYTPPSYLSGSRADVVVTATLKSSRGAGGGEGTKATAVLTVTPGFLQPLTPENVAMGPNGTVTLTGYLAEAGGNSTIHFGLAGTAAGGAGGQGTLGATNCQRSAQSFTSCTVTYTAPAALAATGTTFVVASVGNSPARTSAAVLLNTAGVQSNPATHQAQAPAQVRLGASGGNNNDYDAQGNQIVDCCAGTLGALVQDGSNREYLLSNNHVLARSDHASVGDTIVQPGLIDNNCTPLGEGPGAAAVGSLTGWLALNSSQTNADAAIAQVATGAVDPSGSILELGGRQADGTLAAAPPGISSTGGRGAAAGLGLVVAKSGRTTGLTCGTVSAVNLDVTVDYYLDCAETRAYLTKTFTNQVGLSGNQFSDAGDSGALVVDAANAEPVGLYFTGGVDGAGVSQAVASPAAEVLNELSAQVGSGTSYSFVGGADHPVSCLNYGESTVAAAQARTLADAEIVRAQQALGQARTLVNPSAGILGVATGKSNDHPGEGAVVVYVDETMNVSVPAAIGGVRTVAISTNARAVAQGSAPQTPFEGPVAPLPAAALNAAVNTKQAVGNRLMRQNPAFFGVGVGQSLDNPREAALVVYVDRKQVPAQLAATVDGLRTRYIVMDRMHVTRSYAAPVVGRGRCLARPAAGLGHRELFREQGLGVK